MKKQIICGLAAAVLTTSIGGTALGNAVIMHSEITASAATIAEQGTCGEKLTWKLDSEGTLTISGSGNMDDYTVASWEKVKAPWYPFKDDIKKVVISKGTASIGERAFINCNNITSVTIPTGVKSIGIDAIRNCKSLTSITIPYGVTAISTRAFQNCSGLKSITLPDSITDIGTDAFFGCTNLTDINIPDSVTSIGVHAFKNCTSLSGITIPDSVTKIGGGAFDCCRNLISANIPDGITAINDCTFQDCRSLKSITIPDSVKTIGSDAFYGCNSLLNVTIPASVTSIGQKAFGYYYAIGFDEIKIKELKIYCYPDSEGEKYAKKYNIQYEYIGDKNKTDITFVPGAGYAELSWKADKNAEKYAIAVYQNDKWKLVEKTTDNSYTLRGLNFISKYRVAVFAMYNGKWDMNFSNPVLVVIDKWQPSVTWDSCSTATHQFSFGWERIKNATEYGIAVKIANKWKVVEYTEKTSYTTPRLTPGDKYKVVICAKINGKWDTRDLDKRSFTITIK